MDRTHATSFAPTTTASANSARTAPRPSRYRSRDFGSGYGSSSGYASARSYAQGKPPVARFRLV